MGNLDNKNRVKGEYFVLKQPSVFVAENRGFSNCCEPFLTLVDENDNASHRNDTNSAWSLGETVTFELRKDGVVTSYIPVAIPFPNETNAWYTTIEWRDVQLMDGYGVFELHMIVVSAGLTVTTLWAKYNVQPYQNASGYYLGKGTVRLKSIFNDVNTFEGINFTNAYVVDTLRLKGKFGYWNPLTDVDNVQYTDAEKVKVRREDLTEYELRVDLHGECVIDRLRFHLVSENACYITDHNGDNYTYKYLDYPVIVKSGFEPNWIDGTRKVKGVAKFEDKQRMTKTHFQDNDTNGKFNEPKSIALPATINDAGNIVYVPSGQYYEAGTILNDLYYKLLKDTFKGRVAFDGGIFEAESCLVPKFEEIGINLLDSASLIITPNGYETGKLYAVKSFDGLSDMTVTRATSATRVNASGLIESVGSNVPRLDYSNGSCPSILVEPQRTNIVLNSDTLATQTVTVTAQVYTISFYGTGTVTLSGTHSATVVGLGTARKTYTFTPTAGSLVITVSGTCTNAQLEAGSYATSYIPTTSASVTRNADVINKTGISSLIGQTEGTLFAEVTIPNGADDSRAIAIQGGSDRIGITVSGANVGFFIVDSSGVIYSSVIPITWQLTNKIALAYISGNTTLYVNGLAVLNTTASFTLGGVFANVYLGQYEFAPGTGQNGQSQSATALWKTHLTNTQLAQLTTI